METAGPNPQDAPHTGLARCAEDLCPLNQLRAGARARIRRLSADPLMAQRLRELGLAEDRLIHIVSRSSHLICRVCQARVALSEQLGAHILVEVVGSPH